jgi:hypothetical protein
MRSARTRVLAALVAIVGCASTRQPAPPPPPQAEVAIDAFDEPLALHGQWIVVARYGRVWHPLHVAAGWQPYLYGEWVWTEDGWFWLTDEPWGWATYHYGRWAWDPALGWFWVPGTVWAPAWVAWRVGDGFVGWAPLYPGFTAWWVDAYPLEPPHWIFVPTSSFVAVRIERVAVPRARVPPLVRSSRPAPPPSGRHPSPAPRFGGPSRPLVEQHRGRPVSPARVVAVPAPADTGRRPEPDAVPVYRPAPRAAPARPAAAPAPARPAPQPAAPADRPAEAAPAPERAAPTRRPAEAAPAPERAAPAAPGQRPARARPAAEDGRPAQAPPPGDAPTGGR